MDIFLNANIAYLTLVTAFLFSIVALLVPGTGILEIVSLAALLLAGYSIYNLPVNFLALAVLILGVFPFFLAVRKSGRLLYLALSIAALVIGSVFLFRGNGWEPVINPVLALVVSTLAAGFLWLIARKSLEASFAPPAHNLARLIGAIGEATTDIDGEGSAQIDGEKWSARSEIPITVGSKVRVIDREGFILTVEPVKPKEIEKVSAI